MANPENKQIPYESTQKDIRDAIESVATAIGGIAIPSANHVSYDNSVSGLSATDVQNALDEIVSDIPTVNDGTLTIQQNGETKGTFTANQSGNSTVNIETPTTDIQTAVDEFSTFNGGLLSECIVELVPVQSGSGDPSPDNVRPISGHTQVKVGNVGKNKLQVTMATVTSQGITATVYDDGTVLVNGTATGLCILTLNNTLALNGNYILSGCPSGGDAGTFRMDCYWTGQGALIDSGNGVAISPNGNAITTRIVVMQGVTVNNQLFKPMIRLASDTDPTFEPYLGHLYQVQIGSTVYGGYVDLVSGVLVATYGAKDLGLLNWTVGTDSISQYFYSYDGVPDIKKSSSASALPTAITEIYKPAPSNDVTDYSFAVSATTSTIYVRDTSIADVPTFVSRNTGYKIVYELATPLTIQLSPTMVKALVGENHLSAPLDGQEITESEYRELFTWDEVEAYVNAHSGGGGGVDYSTTEVDTGIKWTDGKPIYMRTFTNVGLPQNAYSATLDLGVEADTIVKIEANDSANAGNATIIFGGVYAKINKTAGNNTILNPTNQLANLTGATLTVYYTKATD